LVVQFWYYSVSQIARIRTAAGVKIAATVTETEIYVVTEAETTVTAGLTGVQRKEMQTIVVTFQTVLLREEILVRIVIGIELPPYEVGTIAEIEDAQMMDAFEAVSTIATAIAIVSVIEMLEYETNEEVPCVDRDRQVADKMIEEVEVGTGLPEAPQGEDTGQIDADPITLLGAAAAAVAAVQALVQLVIDEEVDHRRVLPALLPPDRRHLHDLGIVEGVEAPPREVEVQVPVPRRVVVA
jgi:hypothetical protein